jgi:hypothetical protein
VSLKKILDKTVRIAQSERAAAKRGLAQMERNARTHILGLFKRRTTVKHRKVKYMPHQGPRERARRMRQMGIITQEQFK